MVFCDVRLVSTCVYAITLVCNTAEKLIIWQVLKTRNYVTYLFLLANNTVNTTTNVAWNLYVHLYSNETHYWIHLSSHTHLDLPILSNLPYLVHLNVSYNKLTAILDFDPPKNLMVCTCI